MKWQGPAVRCDARHKGGSARFFGSWAARKLDDAAEMTYTTNGLVPATIMDLGGAVWADIPGNSMERAEYDLMAAVEDRMWWYRGLHALARDAWLRARRAGPAVSSLAVLDAGCGTGGLLCRLAAAVPEAPLVGLEFVEPAAFIARDKSGRRVAVGSVNDLPFGDSSLAAMFSMDVLCHRGVDEGRSLMEACRCLASGGILIVNLPAYRWMLSVHDQRVHNVRRYRRAEVVAMLKRAGFGAVAVSYWNTFLFPLMVLKRKVLGGEESDVKPFSPPLEFVFRSVLCFERMLLRLGLRLPFGGSIFAVAVKP
jgi:SAM-dependent methyltransferase